MQAETASLSPPGTGNTWVWGDVTGEGTVDFTDVSCVVDGFRGLFNPPCTSLYADDLMGCEPDANIDFTDIDAAVSAFMHIPFSSFCPDPCE